MAVIGKNGRQFSEYDLYKNDDYIGRYIAPELMELLGVSRAVIKNLVATGRANKDGYQVLNSKPVGWPECWEKACENLRRRM